LVFVFRCHDSPQKVSDFVAAYPVCDFISNFSLFSPYADVFSYAEMLFQKRNHQTRKLCL
ncbi:TPA: hypothetical protein ACPZ0G_004938, partial [Escherichia coli]